MPIHRFGKRLVELRRHAGKTQLEVAEKVGIGVSYYKKLENGNLLAIPPTEKVTQRLADVLGADENELKALAQRMPSLLIVRSKTGRALAFIVGGIGIFLSVYLLVLGLGYFLKPTPVETRYVAGYRMGFHTHWLMHTAGDGVAVLVKPESISWTDKYLIKVTSKDSSNRIFIGTANQSVIDTYLKGAAYQTVTRLNLLPKWTVTTDQQEPSVGFEPGDPASQSFWTDSVYGTGTQELLWVKGGQPNSLVIIGMDGLLNADITFAPNSPISKIFGFTYMIFMIIFLTPSLVIYGLAVKPRYVTKESKLSPKTIDRMIAQTKKTKRNNPVLVIIRRIGVTTLIILGLIGVGWGYNHFVLEPARPFYKQDLESPIFDTSATGSHINARNSVLMTLDEYEKYTPPIWDDQNSTMTILLPIRFENGRTPTLNIKKMNDGMGIIKGNDVINIDAGLQAGDIVISPYDGELSVQVIDPGTLQIFSLKPDSTHTHISFITNLSSLVDLSEATKDLNDFQVISIKKGQSIGKVVTSYGNTQFTPKIQITGIVPITITKQPYEFNLATSEGKVIILK